MNHWRARIELALKLLGIFSLVIGLSGTPFDSRAEQGENHQLGQGRILKQVLLRVVNNYVDPNRVRPRLMLVKGLEWVQRSVAEVQVSGELPPATFDPPSCQTANDCPREAWPLSTPGEFECFEGECLPVPGEITITVDTESRDLSTRDVRAPWDLTSRMCEIFRFLDDNLPEDVERPQVEYSAINGILSTLDPHSNLLVPDVFEEMQMGTRGEFGGLGIVISMHPGPPCSGHLSIMEVMEGSPAEAAGLQRMDRIVRIDDQPTSCMNLSEAVSRMRGTPGTTVRIWIRRNGTGRSRPVDIVRARIQIDSVESRMLANGVGYIKIENFQINTTTELRAHLSELHRQGMRSLVLDLRDDPGGLLDQAIRVVDTFLPSGTIVLTDGARPEDRESRSAEMADTEPNYPMVVLVNGGSASASEIVAGALRNHDRAIIIGERTFGKGSVQTIYEFDDGSALKLTVAQYLTPGERSIQSVGIVPDLEFGTMTVERDRVDLDPRSRTIREADLEQHLSQRTAQAAEAELRLLLLRDEPRPPSASQCPRVFRCDEEQEESWSEEAVNFAQQLLSGQPGTTRPELIRQASRLVEERQAQEIDEVAEALRPLRVNWSGGESEGSADLEATISVGDGGDTLEAGGSSLLRVQVTNTGEATLSRLRGTTASDSPLLNDHELVFGRLEPGQSRSWEVPICIPAGSTSRADPVTVSFVDQAEHELPEASTRLTVDGREHPSFSYGVQLIDVQHGNGDGRLQRGERASIRIAVRNEGPGESSREADVRLRNEAGDTVVVRSCRHTLGQMNAGSLEVVSAEVEVNQAHEGDTVTLELNITDPRMREAMVERLELPIAEPSQAPETERAVVAVTADDTPLRQAPSSDATIVARAPSGAAFRVTARSGDFYRLNLGGGRPGWVAASSTQTAARPAPRVTEAMANRPPQISLASDPPLAIRDETLHLEGEVTDPDRVLDMYIFVGRRKPFYLSNRRSQDQHQLTFSADIPLEGGSNQVLIVARETSDLVSRRHLVVRRDHPDGTPIQTRDSLRDEEE